MASKLDGFIRPYRGKQDDFDEFWAKFLVLAKANKWADDAAKAEHLPLFLSGQAFTVVTQLSDEDKKSPAKIKSALEQAFCPTPGAAYRSFTSRALRNGEPVDAYLADLKRLLTLSGHKIADNSDPVLIEQFLSGLPADIGHHVRMASATQKLTVTDMANQIRVMQASKLPESHGAVAAASSQPKKSLVCYQCKAVGHVRSQCPKRKPSVTCYACKAKGHISKDCPNKSRVGNVAAGHAPPERTDICLALAKSDGDLVRVAVDVQEPSTESSTWTRFASVVDSGCTRTLVESAVVDRLNLSAAVSPCQDKLLSIDGTPLTILGNVTLRVQRLDGAVHLPRITIDCLVVPNLSSLNTDFLIGTDTIGKVGGLTLRYDGLGGTLSSVVFGQQAGVAAGASPQPESEKPNKLSRHIDVTESESTVTLKANDCQANWSNERGHWIAQWSWKGGVAPEQHIGSGIGEYSRKSLSVSEEEQFASEMKLWVDNGWLVKYDSEAFGEPVAVLPILAVSQQHKASTPVRPCLDYRALNACLVSHPGVTAPACDAKLRDWRRRSADSVLLDIRKAYLQVRIHPTLYKYQTVVYKGELYTMTRMGFGLNVAPKILDMIVQWITRDHADVDNYVDDLYVPTAQTDIVRHELASYGLETKEPEQFATARVLGLQLSSSDVEDTVTWERRAGVDLKLPESPTRRQVFSWCGRVISHYPVCSWLRPLCNYIKRLVGENTSKWDDLVPPHLVQPCREVESRVRQDDPVHGVWSVPCDDTTVWHVWCDASGLAMGAVLEVNGAIVEDKSWLRPSDDKRHINIAELDAVIKSLNLALCWPVKNVVLHTDSRTVHGWLTQLLNNIRRVKVSGLHATLVQRRLQIIDDLITVSGITVDVEWVRSEDNISDQLTRVMTVMHQSFTSAKACYLAVCVCIFRCLHACLCPCLQIIVAGVIGFFYIVLSSWRSSRRRNRLRSFRGAREKQEMEPLGKNADDQEDETIFDMSRA
eukprot:scpid44614/ scgid2187/ 